jgi:integrase
VDSIRKGFINARKRAGLDWVWIHDLRHRAITRWIQEGHPTSAIMKATGHRTFSAFQRYANLREGDIMRLVGRKTEPLPYVTLPEFLGMRVQNVGKTWEAAS